MKKQKSQAFNKDIYLLGKDEHGINYWLEAPSWDCGWYWGFGYIETYTNNRNPSKSRDISSHQHVEGREADIFGMGGKFLSERTFEGNEGYRLWELFKQFYLFRELAGFYHRGYMNVSSNTRHSHKNRDEAERINKVVIPQITAEIIEILTPTDDETSR